MRAHALALVNPNAGGFSPARLDALRRAGVHAQLTPTPAHLDEALDAALSRPDLELWATGGDGTFVTVLSRLHARSDAPPPLGLIPWGSGNAVAGWLGGSMVERTRRSMIAVEGSLTPFLGLGLHGAMAHDVDAARRRVPTRWLPVSTLWQLVPALVSLPHAALSRHRRLRLTSLSAAWPVDARGHLGPKQPPGSLLWEGPALLVDASTCPTLGYGHRFFPHAEVLPGHAQLRVLDMSAASWLRTFPQARRGRLCHPGAHSWLVTEVSIDLVGDSPLSIAGDANGYREQLHLRVQPDVPLLCGYPSSTSL